MYRILDTMARLMAPIMPFTAEEIWKYMPAVADKTESIHLALLPAVVPTLTDDDLAQKW